MKPQPTLVSPRWERPETVQSFVTGKPNEVLMAHLRQVLRDVPEPRVLDIGCGAGRNAVPIAELGCTVVGTDLSEPMLAAARRRAESSPARTRLTFIPAAMAPLPFEDAAFDVIIAHGVWNLSTSDAALRAAVAAAARVAKPGASLFLFTFSRHTLSEGAVPVDGQSFIFTEFGGEPQCFLTHAQVIDELAHAGFVRATDAPLTEYNRAPAGRPPSGGPVLWEGVFVRASASGDVGNPGCSAGC